MRAIYFARCDTLPMPLWQANQALNDFDAGARDITFATFARRVDWQRWARSEGYKVGPGGGLHLKDDYHVQFRKGKFMGVPAYVCMWSAYHVIFLVPGNKKARQGRAGQPEHQHHGGDTCETATHRIAES